MERGSLNCSAASCHNLPFFKNKYKSLLDPFFFMTARMSPWLHFPLLCFDPLFVQCLLGRYYASKRESSVSFSPAPNELPVSQFFKKIYRSVWKVGTAVSTGDAVTEDARRDDPAEGGEKRLQLALAHGFGDAADVQVGSFDVLAAGPGKGNLKEVVTINKSRKSTGN